MPPRGSHDKTVCGRSSRWTEDWLNEWPTSGDSLPLGLFHEAGFTHFAWQAFRKGRNSGGFGSDEPAMFHLRIHFFCPTILIQDSISPCQIHKLYGAEAAFHTLISVANGCVLKITQDMQVSRQGFASAHACLEGRVRVWHCRAFPHPTIESVVRELPIEIIQ